MRRHEFLGEPGLSSAVIIVGLLPLVLLSAGQGLVLGSSVAVLFIADFPVAIRFLVVIPLLITGRARLETMTALALRHVAQSNLIELEDRSHLTSIGHQVVSAQRSWLPRAVILAVIITCVTFLRIDVVEPFSSWQSIPRRRAGADKPVDRSQRVGDDTNDAHLMSPSKTMPTGCNSAPGQRNSHSISAAIRENRTGSIGRLPRESLRARLDRSLPRRGGIGRPRPRAEFPITAISSKS
jgi:hypothetical protein